MKVVTHRIAYKNFGETFRLKPIFDVHLGSVACDEQAFKKYLADSDEKTRFIGGGDLMDCVVPKDAKRYSKSGDASDVDAVLDWQVDRAESLLWDYKDRIIGLGIGNHELSAIKYHSTNVVKRLCRRLGVPYLGFSGLVRLIFRKKDGGGRTVVVRYHHGYGGGSRTQGADLTKYSKDVKHWQADIFLYGHTHKRNTDTVSRIGLVGERIVNKDKHVAICGTYLKTYTKGDDTTYSEERGYPPVSIGGVCIEISPAHEWVKIRAYQD